MYIPVRSTHRSARLVQGVAILAALSLTLSARTAVAQETPAENEQAPAEETPAEATPESIAPPPPVPEGRSVSADTRKIGLTLIPSLRVPLSGGDGESSESESRGADSGSVLALTGRYVPVRNWFVQFTAYQYLDEDKQQPWNGDFSYAFGYEDYRPNTFGISYSNYTNNRFSPDDGDPVTRVGLGTISASYKFEAPRIFRIDPQQRVICRASYNIQPVYEKDSGNDGNWKQAPALGCTLPVWKMFYIEGTAYAYLVGDKQPWDPDFTYSFGWFDWRSKRFSIQYTNYSGNRLPWSDKRGTGGIGKGSVSVSWRLAL